MHAYLKIQHSRTSFQVSIHVLVSTHWTEHWGVVFSVLLYGLGQLAFSPFTLWLESAVTVNNSILLLREVCNTNFYNLDTPSSLLRGKEWDLPLKSTQEGGESKSVWRNLMYLGMWSSVAYITDTFPWQQEPNGMMGYPWWRCTVQEFMKYKLLHVSRADTCMW